VFKASQPRKRAVQLRRAGSGVFWQFGVWAQPPRPGCQKHQHNSLTTAEQPVLKIVSGGGANFNGLGSRGECVLLGFGSRAFEPAWQKNNRTRSLELGRPGSAAKQMGEISAVLAGLKLSASFPPICRIFTSRCGQFLGWPPRRAHNRLGRSIYARRRSLGNDASASAESTSDRLRRSTRVVPKRTSAGVNRPGRLWAAKVATPKIGHIDS